VTPESRLPRPRLPGDPHPMKVRPDARLPRPRLPGDPHPMDVRPDARLPRPVCAATRCALDGSSF
jgi:hypothetical protein